MKPAWNERTLAIVTAGALLVGFGLDLATGDTPEPGSDIRPASDPFDSRATFCPPPFSARTGSLTLAIAPDPGAPSVIGIEPTGEEVIEIPADRTRLHQVSGPPIDVVGYGRRVHTTALLSSTKPVAGAGAARCPRAVSDRWYFPQGSTKLGYDERILIRNPFADEAVVAVKLYTSAGVIERANLNRIAVPAGEARFIRLNDFVTPKTELGASVVAERGRVVAWRALFAAPEDRPAGMQFDLGATGPALEWFMPEGAIATGTEEELSLINPNSREAILTVSLATATRPIQPPKLVEVRVAPESLRTIALSGVTVPGRPNQEVGSAAVIVTSTNGVGVVAERTVWYAGARTGVTSEIGATAAATEWIVGPAATGAPDDSVVILNPNAERATVSVVLLAQDGGVIRPRSLQGLRIKAMTRRRVVLEDLTGGQTMAVVVTSDVPVVAERVAVAANGDVSGVMGESFTPSE